ncbi:MAG: ABC transporter ATP-binding protein [Candidatus Tectomicrobia bacterium]|uniref:ABC transporter ATP-binding protein n=1 Tax=Tectimicrobiota bacterium TaxID=2528274 RepID=A0A933GMZ7_UNCTE|nr:ABC transporter ATP-binding protein [Candidatus Tectomicrobia bacterium]
MFFEIKDLKKWFGGVKAINGINLTVNQGEICSVIGPNGAGKTTLFNLITGYIKPDSGRVTFFDEDITGKHPKRITERGIARSFQIVNIFPRLTVYENIMVGLLGQQRRSLNFIKPAKSLVNDECYSLLGSIGLFDQAAVLAGQLSHGNQKRLEVGLALAMKPKLLLLDEPTAGMAVEEKADILSTIKEMTLKQGCTVFLSEHDMSVIFSFSDIIWVLHHGQVVTQGTVDQIRNNETVRKIYLGEKG